MVNESKLGPIDLFKFINEVTDLGKICPCQEVEQACLSLIGKILFFFQKEFKQVVSEAEEMDMPVFCSLNNSNVKFLGALKNFVTKISSLGIVSEEDVMLVVFFY